MHILGIDPGSHQTGYGLIAVYNGEQEYLRSGIWRAKKSASFFDRLKFLQEQCSALMGTATPQVLVLEEVFLGAYPKAGLQLAQVRGIFLAEAFRKSVPIVEYSARAAKQMVTGYGGAEKTQVSFMVQQKLKVDHRLMPDEADALALCLAYSQNMEFKYVNHSQSEITMFD